MGSIYNDGTTTTTPTMKRVHTAKRAARSARLVALVPAVFILAALVFLSGAEGEFELELGRSTQALMHSTVTTPPAFTADTFAICLAAGNSPSAKERKARDPIKSALPPPAYTAT